MLARGLGGRCAKWRVGWARAGRARAARFNSSTEPSYFIGMSRRRTSKKDTPAKLAKRMSRRWRVVLLRAKGEILGEVEARDQQAAIEAAAVQFSLG